MTLLALLRVNDSQVLLFADSGEFVLDSASKSLTLSNLTEKFQEEQYGTEEVIIGWAGVTARADNTKTIMKKYVGSNWDEFASCVRFAVERTNDLFGWGESAGMLEVMICQRSDTRVDTLVVNPRGEVGEERSGLSVIAPSDRSRLLSQWETLVALRPEPTPWDLLPLLDTAICDSQLLEPPLNVWELSPNGLSKLARSSEVLFCSLS
jgi:hypothetical protein